MGNPISLTLAAFSYQALRYFRSGSLELPSGYKLLGTIEGPDSPRLGFLAQSRSRSRTVLAFRGTEELEDLRRDLTLNQVPYPFLRNAGLTHRGFTELYASVREPIRRLLRSFPRSKPLYLTGHSLGGALACLCALDLAASGFRDVRVYTFGAPKAGDPVFADLLSSTVRVRRYFNPLDPVAGLPPDSLLLFRYKHAGVPVPLPFHRLNPFSNHSMAGYFAALCRRYPTDCWGLGAGTGAQGL